MNLMPGQRYVSQVSVWKPQNTNVPLSCPILVSLPAKNLAWHDMSWGLHNDGSRESKWSVPELKFFSSTNSWGKMLSLGPKGWWFEFPAQTKILDLHEPYAWSQICASGARVKASKGYCAHELSNSSWTEVRYMVLSTLSLGRVWRIWKLHWYSRQVKGWWEAFQNK